MNMRDRNLEIILIINNETVQKLVMFRWKTSLKKIDYNNERVKSFGLCHQACTANQKSNKTMPIVDILLFQ